VRSGLAQPHSQIPGRIRPTANYRDLVGCELVIEAVYEDRVVKADVTRKAEAVIATFYGSSM
jgi:3-hydroxyacyl-CoA dehydrogenase